MIMGDKPLIFEVVLSHKGRRGCLSSYYELGGERTGVGTDVVATWRREGRLSGRVGLGEAPSSTGLGAVVPGGRRARREQGSEAERAVWYEGENRGSGEADRWDHPRSGLHLLVKEWERKRRV
jgi:hypothetical protein